MEPILFPNSNAMGFVHKATHKEIRSKENSCSKNTQAAHVAINTNLAINIAVAPQNPANIEPISTTWKKEKPLITCPNMIQR